MKRRYILLILLLLCAVIYIKNNQSDPVSTTKKDTSVTVQKPAKQTPKPVVVPSFDKTQYSETDPASIWVVVNKSHPLSPKSYTPTDLVLPKVRQRIPGATEMKMRLPAATALEELFAGAKSAGYGLVVSTAYRGYSYQKSLYNSYASKDGTAKADTYSARPGYSEHQTGLAVDIRDQSGTCSLEQCFSTVPSAKWLAANAYKYGFILRYTKDKVAITGYEYEPWHFRYVGKELATEMHRLGIETLEEFFSISGGTVYE